MSRLPFHIWIILFRHGWISQCGLHGLNMAGTKLQLLSSALLKEFCLLPTTSSPSMLSSNENTFRDGSAPETVYDSTFLFTTWLSKYFLKYLHNDG
jgi:hypothetical protein